MAIAKKRQFNVSVAVKAWIDVEVEAESLEDALVKGRKITLDKAFEEGHNNCIDGSIKVTGVYALQDWEK